MVRYPDALVIGACTCIMASTTAPAAADGGGGLDAYRWWSPSASPVTGLFTTAANWEDFIRPPAFSNFNCLIFEFASPADFTATNDASNPFPVAEIIVSNGAATATIAGSPLRLDDASSISRRVDIRGAGSGLVVFRAPLQGTSGIRIARPVRMDPGPLSQHTVSGGFLVAAGGVLEAPAGRALGALSNTITLDVGTFRMLQSFNVAIPVTINDSGLPGVSSSIDTPTVGTHALLLPIAGTGELRKLGQGTLRLAGASSSANIDWFIVAGGLVATEDALGRGDLSIATTSAVELVADNTIGAIRNRFGTGGVLDIGPHTLTLTSRYGPTLDELGVQLNGTGRLVITESAVARVEVLSAFTGTVEVRGGQLSFTGDVDLNPEVKLTATAGAIIRSNQVGPVDLAALTGSGEIIFDQAAEWRIGHFAMSSTYDGRILFPADPFPFNDPIIRKVGGGTLTLTDIDEYAGRLICDAGTLDLRGTLPTGARLAVASGATIRVGNQFNVGSLSGSGTLSVVGRLDLASGGEDITFDGSVIGTESASIRKQGAGTLRLNGDLSGFRGAFDVMGGIARFSGQPIFPNALVMGVNGLGELRGHGAISTLLTNVGVIASDVGGRTMTITGAGKQNLDGVFEAVNGGVLAFDSAVVDQLDQSPGNLSVIRAQNASEIRFVGGASTVNDGRVEADGDGVVRISAPGTAFNGVAFRGNLTIDSGSLVLDGAVLNIDAGVSAGNDLLVVTFSGEPDPAPLISGDGQVNLLGTVEVVLPDGYVPMPGDRVRVAELPFDGSPSVVAEPDAVVLPDIGALPWRTVTTPGSLEYIIACSSADVASPFGALDIDDVLTFLDGFASGDAAADLVADGVFDIDDVLFFLDAFAAGCP